MKAIADDVQAQAAAWVAHMDVGSWSDADEEALQAWLAIDPMRQGLLLRTQARWMQVDVALAAGREPAPTGESIPQPDGRWTGTRRWGRRAAIGGLAAGAAALLVERMPFFRSQVDYATDLGEIRRVPLNDGSVMTVNSASAVAVRMEKQRRLANLIKGEAWFEVAKNSRRPFIVEAGGVFAQAIGTAFSVRMHEAGVEVLVTEGIVEVWSDDLADLPVRLLAGRRALVGKDIGLQVEPEAASSVDRLLAWRGGMIDLNGETVAAAASEFNRYNARKLIVADPRIAAQGMVGVFGINDPEGFAEAVRISFDTAVYKDNPSTIIIGH